MSADSVIVLVPVFNDWESVRLLLPQLEHALAGARHPVHVLLVDDGSTDLVEYELLTEVCSRLDHIQRVEILELRRNLGHQRALAVGLSFIASNRSCRSVVVMDADGEDAPQDVPRLLDAVERHKHRAIVFAARMKRSETRMFRVFYWLYRMIHWLLTGVPVRVGNFSVIPEALLARIVVVSDLWNHYAASVVKSHLRFESIPTRRATRLAGASKMNLVSLVVHGLSAISVFSDRAGVRLILVGSGLALLTLCGLAATIVIRLATDWAIPGWATFTAGLLALMFGQMVTLILVFVLSILQKRDDGGFLPIRDHVHFVEGITLVSTIDERVRVHG